MTNLKPNTKSEYALPTKKKDKSKTNKIKMVLAREILFSWLVVELMWLTVECEPLVAAFSIVEFMWAIVKCAPKVALSGAMLWRRVQGTRIIGERRKEKPKRGKIKTRMKKLDKRSLDKEIKTKELVPKKKKITSKEKK